MLVHDAAPWVVYGFSENAPAVMVANSTRVASLKPLAVGVSQTCLSQAFRTVKDMEVHFTPEQQAQLAQLASKSGTVPERLVTTVVARYLDEEARFLAAVEKGIAAAERGEFIEEDEMDARLEAMFKA